MFSRMLLPLGVVAVGGGGGSAYLYQQHRRRVAARYEEQYINGKRHLKLLADCSNYEATAESARCKNRENAQSQHNVVASLLPLQQRLTSLKQQEQSHIDEIKQMGAQTARAHQELKTAHQWSQTWLNQRKRDVEKNTQAELTALNDVALKEYRVQCDVNAELMQKRSQNTLAELSEAARRPEHALQFATTFTTSSPPSSGATSKDESESRTKASQENGKNK